MADPREIESSAFLIENDADVRNRQLVGETPQHSAVPKGIVKLLILNGGSLEKCSLQNGNRNLSHKIDSLLRFLFRLKSLEEKYSKAVKALEEQSTNLNSMQAGFTDRLAALEAADNNRERRMEPLKLEPVQVHLQQPPPPEGQHPPPTPKGFGLGGRNLADFQGLPDVLMAFLTLLLLRYSLL